MSAGGCIIDGTDIDTLGMFIERDGSNDLLMFPVRRNPDVNDWNEEDGIEMDIAAPTFDAKKVTINYVMIADNYNLFKQRLRAFEQLHYQPGNRAIYIREFATTFILRFEGFSGYKHQGGYYNPSRKVAKIYVDYWMDDPLQMYTSAISAPVGPSVIRSHVVLSGRDLSAYGIVVNEIYSSALKPRSAKDILVRKVNIINGQEADKMEIGQTGVFVEKKKKSRELSIDCTMTADTTNELMINMTALFGVMRSSTPISLKIAHESLYCYYTKMSRFRKAAPFSRKVRVEFTLQLKEVSWKQLIRLLASQSLLYVISTQDGKIIKAT